jgi:UDP-N-acetylmuramate--alanine ligase
VLEEAGFDPTVLVGEEVQEFGGVIRMGASEWFVAEVCEYDRSFHDVAPTILVLTNIEEEHLDTYPGGLEEIREAFKKYIASVKDNGVMIACSDNRTVSDLVNEIGSNGPKVIRYGFGSDQYNSLSYPIKLPGKHNIQNALAVVAISDYLKISESTVKKVLEKFSGAHRRFEYKGSYNGAPIIDDYGHHPTEISSTLEALKERYPNKRKVVVFWPHQFKRVKPLLNQFASSFNMADEIIIKPIYFVPGRDEILDVSSQDIADMINEHLKKASVMETDEEIVRSLRSKLDNNYVLLTIGIPPVYKIAETLASSDMKEGK